MKTLHENLDLARRAFDAAAALTPSKRVTAWVGLVAAIAGTAYAYDTVIDISQDDVLAYHRLAQAVTDPVRPGHLMALSPTGKPVWICSFTDERVGQTPIDRAYRNRLGDAVPDFDALVEILLNHEGDSEPRKPRVIRFKGALQSLPRSDVDKPREFTLACECEMARQLMEGGKVCTVQQALVEQGERVRGAQLSEYTNFPVTRALYEQCNVRFDPARISALFDPDDKDERSCEQTNLPWSVKARRFFDLIREEMPQTADAVTEAIEG